MIEHVYIEEEQPCDGCFPLSLIFMSILRKPLKLHQKAADLHFEVNVRCHNTTNLKELKANESNERIMAVIGMVVYDLPQQQLL